MNTMVLMRQFTIRVRMLGAIGMVLALLSLLGLGGLWGMGHIKAQNDDFLHHSFAEVQHLSHLRGALAQVRLAEKDMLIAYADVRAVDAAYTRWKDGVAEAQTVAKGFLEGEEDPDNVVIRSFLQQMGAYAQAFETVVAHVRGGQISSAAQLPAESAQALAAWQVMEPQVAELETILRAEVDSSVQEHDQIAVVVRWVFAGALALATLVVVPLTILNMHSICQPLERARLLAQAIAGGDLSQQVQVVGKDEVADLQRAQQAMQNGLSAMVSQVRNASESVATASQEIASGNQDLSLRTEKSASSVQDTVSSLTALTENVQQTAHAAQTARQLSDSAFTLAARGGQVVTQAVGSMHEIAASSSKINDIIGLIDSIAFQTNILALNAAVEAARAGEQGRGFAVVASEVRMLAKRSAAAAQEIKLLVSSSVQAVDGGVRLVEEAGAAMKEMVEGVQRVGHIIGEISSSATEQSSGIAQVNQSVGLIDQATQQNAALVEQSAAAAEGLREQADALAQVVRQFRLQTQTV